jgi:prepilin-type N-terminal cleavage/methylation domain-containing protein
MAKLPARRGRLRRSRAGHESGYTLIELLAVMAILGTVLAMLTSLFASGMKHEQKLTRKFSTQQEARLALDRIRREVHCASQLSVTGGGASLSMVLPPQCPTSGSVSVSVSYQTTNVASNRYRLTRTMNSVTSTVADYLTAANVFSYTAPSYNSLGRLHVDFPVNVYPTEGWNTWRLTDDIALRNTLRF